MSHTTHVRVYFDQSGDLSGVFCGTSSDGFQFTVDVGLFQATIPWSMTRRVTFIPEENKTVPTALGFGAKQPNLFPVDNTAQD